MQQKVFFALKYQLTVLKFFYAFFWILLGAIVYFKQDDFNYWSVYACVFVLGGLIYLFIVLKSLYQLTPGLYLDDQDLIIKNTISKFKVTWLEISSFEIHHLKRSSVLIVRLLDNKETLARQNSRARRLGGQFLTEFGSPLVVPIDYFQAPRIEILAELNYYLEKSHLVKK
jgi:hypothetical protein